MVSATLQLHPAPVLFDSLSRLHSPRRFLNLPHRSSSSFTSTFPAATVTSPGNRISDVKLSSFPNTNPHRPWSSSAWITNWSNRGFRPFPKRPRAVVDYRHGLSSDDDELGTSRSAGSSTMAKIVEKLKKYGYIEDSGERDGRALPEKGSVEDIFYAEDGILPDPKGGLSLDLSEGKIRFPWEKHQEGEGKEEGEFESGRKKPSKSSLAELTLPQGELQRLRHLAFRIKSKTKIGGRGVTKEVVDLIHEKWRTEEVVRIKCEGPPALNMKRTHEILEVT